MERAASGLLEDDGAELTVNITAVNGEVQGMSRTIVLPMVTVHSPELGKWPRSAPSGRCSRALFGRALAAAMTAVLLAVPVSPAAAAPRDAGASQGTAAPGEPVAPGGAALKPSAPAARSAASKANPLAARASPPAAAQAKPSQADRAAAQALFDEGRELMERGRPADACPRFEESARLEPGLGTRFHLATCYEALGKFASAHTLFLEVAAEAAARNQAAREKVARERAQAVEPRLARLSIEVPFVTSPALRIERDGAEVARAEWGLSVPVDPGVHHIVASAPGREPWSSDVEVSQDPSVTRVNVPPLAERRQPFFAPLSRKIGLVALGAGAGTLALGGVFAVQAVSKKKASDRAGCGEHDCDTETGLALRREALRAGDRATWAVGLGLVGVGAAAALFWVVPSSEEGNESDVQLSPAADLSSASLHLTGQF